MKKLLILLLSTICLFSCVEDEGNYTYSEMNQVTIEGLEETYRVLDKIDVIQIEPKITGSVLGDNLEHYEYQWHIHEGLGEHNHTVISNEKDLTYEVDLPVGGYTLYLTVLDKTTGLKTIVGATLNVTTPTSKGFLLLGDDLEEGIMGMDMVIMPAGRDTSVMENVYDNSETRFTGADRVLYQGPRYNETQSLWMCVEDGSFRMNNIEDISIISELNDYGLIELSSQYNFKKPMRVKDVFPRPTQTNRSGSYRGYLTEDVAVLNMILTAEYYAQPCNRLSANSNELFKFYPLAFTLGTYYSGHGCVLLYNKDEERFMKINTYFNASYCTTLSDYNSDVFPWDQRDTGRTIVWGGNSVNGSYGSSYAIMKDQEGKHFLYKFRSGPYSALKEGFYEIDLSVATNFAEASHYMVSGTNSLLLYAHGSTLYMYDYAYKTLLTKDMGAEITYLDLEYCSKGSRTEFVVATYSEAEKGTVYKLEVGTDVNKMEIIERPREVWKTRLRVKDVEWKRANGS